MRDPITQTDAVRYKKMIISFVNTAIAKTDGIVREYDVVRSKFGVSAMNTKNIHVYILEDSVTVDVFINVLYGYAVPQVVCKLQENIINLIKESTPFKVKNVNVNVCDVIFG